MPKYFSAAVLSNVAALPAAFVAPFRLEPLVSLPFVLAGIILAASSSGFHAVRNDWWQKLDVWAVMVQIFAVCAGLIGAMGQPLVGFVLFLTCSGAYFPLRKQLDSTIQAIVWITGGALLATMVMDRTGILVVWSLLAVACAAKSIEWHNPSVGAHGLVHALGWHVPVQLIPLAVVILI